MSCIVPSPPRPGGHGPTCSPGLPERPSAPNAYRVRPKPYSRAGCPPGHHGGGRRRAPAAKPTGGDIMRRAMGRLVAIGGLLAILGGVAVAQDKKPDATLKLSEGSVAAGIGFSWGKGTLSYQGKTHAVKVQGLSVGE